MENSVTAEISTAITKKCSRCEFEGPLSAFPKDKAFSTGVRPECRVCYRADRRKWDAAKTPEQKRAKHKQQIARHKERYHSDPDFKMYVNRAVQESMNRKNYGLDPIDIATMLNNQGLCCKTCGEDIRGHHNVDHDHDTNRVRGILCGSCNRGLGLFQDSPVILMNAIVHLCAGTVS